MEQLRALIARKPEYLEALRNIVQFEKDNLTAPRVQAAQSFDPKGDSYWSAREVGILPVRLNRLVETRAVKVVYSSSRHTHYRLVDRGAIETLILEGVTAMDSNTAILEMSEIAKMDEEYNQYLEECPEISTTDFHRGLDVARLRTLLEAQYGPVLAKDCLLTLVQQFGLANCKIVNANGKPAGSTGNNISLFGDPGTGKTFPSYHLICGDPRLGVPAHGLPGRNRYCGGMTAAKFIRMAQAYEGRVFNFIATEFNDWFKSDGMIEPLKLAMEQGRVVKEMKMEVIGPYQFDSYFSTNYNTKTSVSGYRTTVSDPNFNAIEDRMLCRLHRMTKDRYLALSASKKRLRQGRIDYSWAPQFRAVLTATYDELVTHGGQVEIDDRIEDALSEVEARMLYQIPVDALMDISARQQDRAVSIACAAALLRCAESGERYMKLTDVEIEFARSFYLDELEARTGVKLC